MILRLVRTGQGLGPTQIGQGIGKGRTGSGSYQDRTWSWVQGWSGQDRVLERSGPDLGAIRIGHGLGFRGGQDRTIATFPWHMYSGFPEIVSRIPAKPSMYGENKLQSGSAEAQSYLYTLKWTLTDSGEKIRFRKSGLTRAPPGGKYYPLRDIRHSSETVLDIDMKLSIPYGTTI